MRRLALAVVVTMVLAACGGGAEEAAVGASDPDGTPQTSPLHVVATTSILGDLVASVVQEDARVEVILPIGADPHGFAPSAAQAGSLREADLVVANGLDLEEGLVSALESAEEDGVTVFHATDHVDLLTADVDDDAEEEEHAEEEGHPEDEHAEEEHAEEGHADEDDHGHEGEDPHIWFDPVRMGQVVEALGAELAAIDDAVDWEARAADVVAELTDLDAEIREMVQQVPEEDRLLVTNHEVLGYFADAYDFELTATLIPGGSTLAEPSAADLGDVIETVRETGVPAIFAETTAGSRIAEVVAEEVGTDVAVVELYTESLSDPDGPAGTYVDMMRTNATLIVEALQR